ncbi:MAG: hypothetical protein CXT67_10205, partial [Methanobacteriota archaeon]
SDDDGWYDTIDDLPQESTQWIDSDGDGYGDDAEGNEPDACPSIAGNSTEINFGCLDSDGDGYADADDIFENEKSQWNDTDADGYGDNPNGITPDACPTSDWKFEGKSNIDRLGCPDSDVDGISNPDSEWTIDMGADACPNTYGNSSNDRVGCYDADGDGWSNPTADWTIEDGAEKQAVEIVQQPHYQQALSLVELLLYSSLSV